jgi:hypothetical protein
MPCCEVAANTWTPYVDSMKAKTDDQMHYAACRGAGLATAGELRGLRRFLHRGGRDAPPLIAIATVRNSSAGFLW